MISSTVSGKEIIFVGVGRNIKMAVIIAMISSAAGRKGSLANYPAAKSLVWVVIKE